MAKRLVHYRCPTHGEFAESVERGRIPGRVSCPQCGARSATTFTTRAPGDGGVPFVQGDVRRPYYSHNLNRFVSSKADIRAGQAEREREGFVPLSDRDIKTGIENAHNRAAQAKRDLKWFNQNVVTGVEGVTCDVSSGEASLPGYDPVA